MCFLSSGREKEKLFACYLLRDIIEEKMLDLGGLDEGLALG